MCLAFSAVKAFNVFEEFLGAKGTFLVISAVDFCGDPFLTNTLLADFHFCSVLLAPLLTLPESMSVVFLSFPPYFSCRFATEHQQEILQISEIYMKLCQIHYQILRRCHTVTYTSSLHCTL